MMCRTMFSRKCKQSIVTIIIIIIIYLMKTWLLFMSHIGLRYVHSEMPWCHFRILKKEMETYFPTAEGLAMSGYIY